MEKRPFQIQMAFGIESTLEVTLISVVLQHRVGEVDNYIPAGYGCARMGLDIRSTECGNP